MPSLKEVQDDDIMEKEERRAGKVLEVSYRQVVGSWVVLNGILQAERSVPGQAHLLENKIQKEKPAGGTCPGNT